MAYQQLITKLGYNPKYFAYYMSLRASLGTTEPALEDILLESDCEMASFCMAPLDYERSFVNLFERDLAPQVSYLAFCRQNYLFPFSDEFADEYRKCESCAFVGETPEGDYICDGIYVGSDYLCYQHTFATSYIPDGFGR